MSTQIKSSLAYVKQPDGSYIPIFYVNTADDVYVDIEKSMTLGSMINNGTIRNQIYNVDNDTERFALTENEVKLHDIVNVYNVGSLYEVIDITKLSTEDGYKKIVVKDAPSMPLKRINTSILDEALNNVADDTVSNYMLQGVLYTGNDLPSDGYRFSSATIYRRYNIPTVILWGSPNGSSSVNVPMINHYVSNANIQRWTGWAPLGMTATDREKLDVLFTKGATTLSANPSKVIYVDPVNGLDTNTGLTVDLSMQTIKAAMAKYGGLGNLNIRLADGEYNDTSVLTFNGMTRVVINGNSNDNTKVIIKFPFYTSDVPTYIDGVTIDVSTFPANSYTSSDNPYALLFRGATFSVTNSRIIGSGLGVNSAIIGRNGTIGYISACDFSNWNIAVRSEIHSNVYCTKTTTSGDINITYSAVSSTIEFTEDTSTPIQNLYAKNLSGIIIKDGININTIDQLSRQNYLHNWDFTNAYVVNGNNTVNGIGTFLSRWRSDTPGNTVVVSPYTGLTLTTYGSVPGIISQTLSSNLVYLSYRYVTFSAMVSYIPKDTEIKIGIYTINGSNVESTVAEKVIIGTGTTPYTLHECSGQINHTYVRLICRIYINTPDKPISITKVKLETGDFSTLRNNSAMDISDEAIKCQMTDINGNYMGLSSISMADATLI